MDTEIDQDSLKRAAEKGGVVSVKSSAPSSKRKTKAKDIYEQEMSAVTKKRKKTKSIK